MMKTKMQMMPVAAAMLAAFGLFTGRAVSQNAPNQPVPAPAPAADPVAQPQPATDKIETLVYEVVKVQGTVNAAPAGADPVKLNWQPVKQGDRFGAGDVISTGLRGQVQLVAVPATPPTVIHLERGTTISIRELQIRNGAARARLDLAQGAVRAGVVEAEVRSDMEIECPVATLSKRGTDIFRMEYLNGRFAISLSDRGRGQLQAIQLQWGTRGDLISTRSRMLLPGQRVTDQMARVIETLKFDRDVTVQDLFGLRGGDLLNLLEDRGLAVLIPQGGNPFNYLDTITGSGRIGTRPDWDQPEQDMGNLLLPPVNVSAGAGVGNFGIGGFTLPGILGNLNRNIVNNANQCRMADNKPCPLQTMRKTKR